MTLAPYTTPPFSSEIAAEYAVAPVEVFQLKVGVSVVTVGPGDAVLPGESPVGISGTAAETVTSWAPDEQVLVVSCEADS